MLCASRCTDAVIISRLHRPFELRNIASLSHVNSWACFAVLVEVSVCTYFSGGGKGISFASRLTSPIYLFIFQSSSYIYFGRRINRAVCCCRTIKYSCAQTAEIQVYNEGLTRWNLTFEPEEHVSLYTVNLHFRTSIAAGPWTSVIGNIILLANPTQDQEEVDRPRRRGYTRQPRYEKTTGCCNDGGDTRERWDAVATTAVAAD